MTKTLGFLGKNGKRRLLLALGGVVLAAAIYGGWIYFFPLEASEFSTRIALWRMGVKELKSLPLHGYLRDQCEKGTSSTAECTCVVLIHGLGDNALTWKKILEVPPQGWRQMMPSEAGSGVKIFAFDLPGSGKSPGPSNPEDYRVRRQAEKLRETIAPLCPHWVAVGNSLGGWIASWLALDWGEGVNKLVLLSAAGLKREEKAGSSFSNPTVESIKEFQKRAYYKPRPIPDRVWPKIVERMKASNMQAVISAQVPADRLDDQLPALRRPTIIVWGKNDGLLPPENGKVFQSLIPGSILREIPQCGHIPQKECPLVVVRAIADAISLGAM